MLKQNKVIPGSYQGYHKTLHIRNEGASFKQKDIAKQLGISKSYCSMLLSGKRKCPSELMEKLQSIPGIHKVVNNQLWLRTGSQKVVGSNPISSTNLFSTLITTG